MKQDWENFKKAIKEARRTSTILYGFWTWRRVQVAFDNPLRFIELNPFCVNLITGEYMGTEITDIEKYKVEVRVPNLKEYFMNKKEAEE